MADVFKNFLAYFFRGFSDSFYGHYKLYEYGHTTSEICDNSQKTEETKNLTVLAQRRASKKSPEPTENKGYEY